jgi:PAS domain S-box-containing protein
MPPYEQYGKVTLKEAIRQHWITICLAFVVFMALSLIVFLSMNIKQRKQKYQILKEAKQKLDLIHAMIVETPDAVFIKDKRSRYVFVNPEAEKLFGRAAGEIIGKDATDLFPDDISQVMIHYDRMVISGSNKVTYEKMYSVSGTSRYMLVTKGPMYDDKGNVDGVFAVCRDITGFKQLQGEIEERVLELETALSKVRLLEGIIPICSYCKKIRDDEESWQQMEKYIMGHSEAQFSHGICPECAVKVMKEIDDM